MDRRTQAHPPLPSFVARGGVKCTYAPYSCIRVRREARREKLERLVKIKLPGIAIAVLRTYRENRWCGGYASAIRLKVQRGATPHTQKTELGDGETVFGRRILGKTPCKLRREKVALHLTSLVPHLPNQKDVVTKSERNPAVVPC